MKKINKQLSKIRISNSRGQGMVDYALIIGLVAVFLIGSLNVLTLQISGTFNQINNALSVTSGGTSTSTPVSPPAGG